MRWKCVYCGKTKTTNDTKAQKPTAGCKVSKDKKCKWVRAD